MNENSNRRREVADSPFDVYRMDQLDLELLNATEHMFDDTGSDTEEDFPDDDIELRPLARQDALREWAEAISLAFNIMISIFCVPHGGSIMMFNIKDIMEEESRDMEEDAYLQCAGQGAGCRQ